MSVNVSTARTAPAVVVGAGIVLLMALLAGQFAGRSYQVAAIAAGGVAALVILTLVVSHLGLGVALVPFVAATVPFAIGTGTQSPIVAALVFSALLFGLWIARMLAGQELRLVGSPVNAPIFVFAFIWIVSYVYSNIVQPPLFATWDTYSLVQLAGLVVALVSMGVLLLALNTGRDQRWIVVATGAFLFVGVVGAIAFLLHLDAVFSVMSAGGLFTMWVVALSYGQALFNNRLPFLARLGLLALAIIWLARAILTQLTWFSGWVPAVIAVGVITLFRSKAVFGVGVAAVVVGAATHVQELYTNLWVNKVVGEGDLTRLNIWQQSWAIFSTHPILGTGPAGYALYNRNLFPDSPFSLSTHSGYMDVVAQTGIVGTLAFVWFLVTLLVVGWRARRIWREGFAGGYAQGAYGGLIGLIAAMGLGDWFIPFVYNQTIVGYRYTVHSWVFLGFLLALALIRPETRSSPR